MGKWVLIEQLKVTISPIELDIMSLKEGKGKGKALPRKRKLERRKRGTHFFIPISLVIPPSSAP